MKTRARTPSAFPTTIVEPFGPWFHALARGVRSWVVILDGDARSVYASHAAVEILCAVEPTGAHEDLDLVDGALPERVRSACREGRLPVEAVTSVRIGEHRRRVRVEAVPPEDDARGALVMIDDRTQRSVLESSLAVASRSESLIRAEIHDLRAPLNALGLTAELLRESLEREPDKDAAVRAEQVASVAVLRREVARLDRMLSSFLRKSAGRSAPRREPVELRRLARRVGRLVRPQARSAGVEIVIDVPDVDVHAWGDEDRLRQALLNVVLNGIEASPRGVELRVRVDPGARPRVLVEDRGPGIPHHLRRRVFEMSFTTKRGGTGIGLTVSRTLVESMGGGLEIAARDGGGTIVELALRPAGAEGGR